MAPLEIPQGPHRRLDPLRDSWVLVSAGRDQRPWQGQVERTPVTGPPSYDPTCYLCPGNERATGARNPAYASTFVFDNDFPALVPVPPGDLERREDGLHVAEGVSGTARVICFTPRHDISLSRMSPEELRAVVDLWADQTRELGARHRWVQVFENRGEAMGASNPHPHGQIWAGSSLPTEIATEDATQRAHLARTGRVLLDDARDQERGGPRVVEEVGGWLAVVPFWASWPYETLLIGPAPAGRIDDLDDRGRDDLGTLVGRLTRRYDALFDRPFPYSFGWHGAPFRAGGGDDPDTDHWRLHAHIYPPLLRPDKRKFMVGYELLAEPQRDLTPESAAAALQAADAPPPSE
jgi:UDPglucose--hexose-1-phosphate uridylyltransferase